MSPTHDSSDTSLRKRGEEFTRLHGECEAQLRAVEASRLEVLHALEALTRETTCTFEVLPFSDWKRLRVVWEAASAVAQKVRAAL